MGKLFLTYRPMVRVVNGLFNLGYLKDHRGFYNQGEQFGFNSRMRATEKLIDLIKNYSVTSSMVSKVDDDVIVLRDGVDKKKHLPFKDTTEIIRMRDHLLSFNSFLDKFKLDLSLSKDEIRLILEDLRANPIDYTRTRLYRKFKFDFSSGGRFYNGWWQDMPKIFRPHLIIDDKPCSELDYSGQHLLLLYALKGEEFFWLKGIGDPYAMPGLGDGGRDLMKQVVLRCVNSESRNVAIQAIRKEINFNYPKFTSTNEFINPLIDETLNRHPKLADCFFGEMWGELQYKDSQIAEYVLTHMQARGQPVLPVHDSFVVQDDHIEHLYSTMIEAYRMLGLDSIPDLKLKPGANSNRRQPSFQALNKRIKKDRSEKRKELNSIKQLEKRIN